MPNSNYVTLISLWLSAPPQLQETVLQEARRLVSQKANASNASVGQAVRPSVAGAAKAFSRRSILGALAAGAATGVALPAASATLVTNEVSVPSRREQIRECIARLDALLTEEAGDRWRFWLTPEKYVEVDGRPPVIATDWRFAGLHDPTGILGQRLEWGKPID
jgi:hypothetical protein